MLTKLRHWWQDVRSSFWFVPAIIVLTAILLATTLVVIDANIDLHVDKKWPLLFGAGADGARGLLTAVASSMITVAALVFSITIVALSLTSSQYTSRVLRNFMRDRINQTVLGVFVGIFAYCLVVLRTIRGGDEVAFVPSFAVLGGLLLALFGIAILIYFIHHISLSIQASNIIATAAEETTAAIDHLFPEGLGEDADQDSDDQPTPSVIALAWFAIPAQKTGYIEAIDGDALFESGAKAKHDPENGTGIGEFVIAGTTLLSIASPRDLDEESIDKLNAVYFISRQRTVHQDAAFGIRQIVDIALKALSPGINDTTTALMCVDYLAAILVRLAPRRIASPRRLDAGELRLISRGPSFQSLLAEAFDQIRGNAGGNVAVLIRQIEALEVIAGHAVSKRRRQALRQHAELIQEVADRTLRSPHDAGRVQNSFARLVEVLNRLDDGG